MSIATEIARISKNISDSLDAVADKGVVVPAGSNSDDLPELISQILSGSGSVISIVDEQDSHGGTIRHINAVSLEGDTVSANTLLSGYTAHNRLGDPIVGTYVPPSASALNVKAITVNDTYNASGDNLDGYSQVLVNVPEDSGMNVQTYIGQGSVNTTSYTETPVKITVAKTGTYKISWCGFRSSTSGTSGSRLYRTRDGTTTAIGSASTTFNLSDYGQRVELIDQSLNADDILTIYARSSNTSSYMYIANLVIEQTA